MPNLHLVEQEEAVVKKTLETSLRVLRDNHYALPWDYGCFLKGFMKGLYYYFTEGNQPLLDGLRGAITKEPKSIADFCCGSGKGTLGIATTFPTAEIYGFDIMPPFIARAKKRSQGNPRVHFKQRDVYTFDDAHTFDVVTFHDACGTLADKVMQYGTEHHVPVIAGKFCCYHAIPHELPRSQNTANNLCLILMGKVSALIRYKVARNYITPRDAVDRDLLSVFVGDQLGVTEDELELIAATAVDSKLGISFIDLNRVMKLLERNYSVGYDATNHIVVAKRRLP